MSELGMLPPLDPPRRAGHETTDASPRLVGLFGLSLAIVIALVLPLAGWIFWRFEAASTRSDSRHYGFADNDVPSGPRLAIAPAADLARVREAEDEALTSYARIEGPQPRIRIPIDRAIELLAERGLPEPAGPLEPPPKQEQAP